MSGHGLALLVAFAIVSGGLVLTALYFRRVNRRPARFRPLLMNLTLSGFAVLYALLFLELAVQHAFVETDGMDFTLSSQQWFDRHWNTINQYGFRDPEYDLADLRGARRLYVVGDSFVAGHGIADPADRFSNVLARALGSRWRVVNMARVGWDTGQERRALESFPLQPDVVVLAYVFNDIEGVAAREGLRSRDYLYKPSTGVRRIIDRSYLLNLLYWRFYWRITQGPQVSRAYREFIVESFADQRVWKEHREDLRGIIEYARKAGSRLLVVVFPAFLDPAGTRAIMSPLYRFLEEEGVAFIDLAEVFENRPLQDLVVNSLDHHPSVAVNREVAHLIYARLGATGMLGRPDGR